MPMGLNLVDDDDDDFVRTSSYRFDTCVVILWTLIHVRNRRFPCVF
jgi:hypothetical protein